MIKSFASKATEEIYHGVSSKSAKSFPESIWGVAQRKLDMINAAHLLSDLRIPPGNRLERLKGNMSSYHALRINDQFRIVFRWVDGHAFEVTIVDYH
jgi:proteic killer suppression protein